MSEKTTDTQRDTKAEEQESPKVLLVPFNVISQAIACGGFLPALKKVQNEFNAIAAAGYELICIAPGDFPGSIAIFQKV